MTEETIKLPSIVQEFRGALIKQEREIRAVLPSTITWEEFQRITITAYQMNPDLHGCTAKSVMAACMRCAEIGLVPDGHDAAIVKFRKKVSKRGEADRYEDQAQAMPMIGGLRKHVEQSGSVLWWKARIVREGDVFEHIDGDDERLTHIPGYDDDAPIRFFYSIAKLANGELVRAVMTVRQVDAIRARSKSKDFGPWSTDYPEMGKKTVMRRLYKDLPRAKDPAKAIAIAKAVRTLDEAMEIIDIEPEQPPASAAEIASRQLEEAQATTPQPEQPRKRRGRRPASAANAEAQTPPTSILPSPESAYGAATDGDEAPVADGYAIAPEADYVDPRSEEEQELDAIAARTFS